MNIFVGNMSREVNRDNLKIMFENYGKVTAVTILIDKIQDKWQAFGFIEMPDQEEAENAIDALDGFIYMGQPLTVHTARFRSKDRRRPGRYGGRRTTDLSEVKRPNNPGCYSEMRLFKVESDEIEE